MTDIQMRIAMLSCVHHSSTYMGFCKLKDFEYDGQGVPLRFINALSYARAFNAYLSVKPQDFPARTRCDICGDNPDILTCDGIVMSLQQRRATMRHRMMEEVRTPYTAACTCTLLTHRTLPYLVLLVASATSDVALSGGCRGSVGVTS
jgi:hypothetical protein